MTKQHTCTPPRPPEGKHSPLPWTTDKLSVRDASMNAILYLGERFGTRDESIDNADLIVTAVNLHAKLVAALEAQTQFLFSKGYETEARELRALLREAAK